MEGTTMSAKLPDTEIPEAKLPEVVVPKAAPATREAPVIPVSESGKLQPYDIQHMSMVATKLAGSQIVKEHGFKNADDLLYGMLVAQNIGLNWALAPQYLYVVKGKVSIPGETLLATIRGRPECMYVKVKYTGEIDDGTRTCTLYSKRKRVEEYEPVSFSLKDAVRAELYPGKPDKYGNPPVWSKYPDDMLCWKAVARMARRYWSDMTHGIGVVEDLQVADTGREFVDVTPSGPVATVPAGNTRLLEVLESGDSPVHPADFDSDLPAPALPGEEDTPSQPPHGSATAEPEQDPAAIDADLNWREACPLCGKISVDLVAGVFSCGEHEWPSAELLDDTGQEPMSFD